MKRRGRTPPVSVHNVTRRHPARLTTLVRAHLSQLRRQFATLRGWIIDEFTSGEFAINAFCHTGPGGGVDPSCSPTHSLSDGEKASLSKWMAADHEAFQAMDKGDAAPSDAYLAFKSALSKIPNHEGQVHRGLHSLTDSALAGLPKQGEEFALDSSTSSSESELLGLGYAMRELGKGKWHETHGAVFHIDAKTGANIKPYQMAEHLKHEDEVVLRKGTRYVVDRVHDVPTRRIDDNGEEYGKPRLIRHIYAKEVATHNEFNPAQPRDDTGKWAAGVGAVKAVLKRATDLSPSWLKVTGGLAAKASMALIIAGNKAVTAVAKERGLTDAQVSRVSKVVACVDVAMGGWRGAGAATALGLGALAVPAAVVPLGSLSYLAYSTARNPMATYRAARKAVIGAVAAARELASLVVPGQQPLYNAGTSLTDDETRLVATAVIDHDYDAWYEALLFAALDRHQDVGAAVAVAGRAAHDPTLSSSERHGGRAVANYDPDQLREPTGRWTKGATGHEHSSGYTLRPVKDEHGSRWAIHAPDGSHLRTVKKLDVAKGLAEDAASGPGATLSSSEKGRDAPGRGAAVRASILREIAGTDRHLGVDLRDLHGRLEREHGAMPVEDMHRHVLDLRGEGKLSTEQVTRHESGLLHSPFTIKVGMPDKWGQHNDQIGYVKPVRNFLTENWVASTSPERLNEFQRWLRTQLDSTLTGKSQEQMWTQYIRRGWQQGAGRAFDDTNKARPRITPEDQVFYQGGRQQFLRDAFNQPVARERVDLLASRTFDEMEDVSRDVANRMSRALVDGLIGGSSSQEITSALVEATEFGRGRAEKVARTEIMRAHAEGQLDGFQQMGVQELGVLAELSTSGLGNVCEECAALAGETYTIEEARGLIPVHPQCECVWVPNTEGA